MGPSQICGCPFRGPRVFDIAHVYVDGDEDVDEDEDVDVSVYV